MRFRKFDIVLVDFPFTDLSNTKKRPALVVSSLEGDNDILCQITTKKRFFDKYEAELLREFCIGNIKFDSYIYVDLVFTLHRKLIYGKIGEVIDTNMKEKINSKINLVFR